MKFLIVLAVCVGASVAQFEAGFVKILEDKRYQEGAAFGNFRRQEDGIQYQEETDGLGVRRGFWEYPDENGQLNRVEFEAGPGIGFRIVNSNFIAPSLQDNSIPATRPKPVAPVQHRQPAPVQHRQVAPLPVQTPAPLPVVPQFAPTTTTPGPLHLFDYPANLEFSRHAGGHSFKFSAA